MDDKIILSIGGILMLGLVTVTSIDEPCMKDGEVFLDPAVTIEVEVGKICFEFEEDYQVYKEDVLKKLKDQEEFIYEDAILMITEEEERGNLDKNNFLEEGGLNNEIQQLIIDENITYFPEGKSTK